MAAHSPGDRSSAESPGQPRASLSGPRHSARGDHRAVGRNGGGKLAAAVPYVRDLFPGLTIPVNSETPHYHLSGMIPVARFYCREEADELAALADENGIFAPVVDPKRLPRAFDATLGGFDAALGFSVY